MGNQRVKEKSFINLSETNVKPDITVDEFVEKVEITEPVKKFTDVVVFIDYITYSVLSKYPEFKKLVQNEWNDLRLNDEMLEIVNRLTKLLRVK